MCYLDKLINKQQKRYHKDTYINFKKAIKSKLTKDELEAKLDSLIADGYIYIKHTTKRASMGPKSYCLTCNERLVKLTVYDGDKYYWFTTNHLDDAKNKDTGSPFADFKHLFKDRTTKTLTEVFGKTDQLFKKCCPQPLYYQNQLWAKETWINNICKEDFSSHYPSNAIGILPDANTMEAKIGYYEPTEEYPFAFYLNSGHVAVYNEFNSRDFVREVKIFGAEEGSDRLYPTNYTADIKEEFTILMKAAKETIEPEMRHYYDIKRNSEEGSAEYKSAKLFILKFIGMMEQCSKMMYKSYPYAHLAAVIKWRANIKTFKILKTIGYKNVLQVCVDGFIHKGKPLGTDIKELGNLITEFSNAKFIQRGINQYIIKDTTKIEKKFAGFDINIDSDNIMDWQASSKIKFLKYLKSKYEIEDFTNEN